VIPRTYADPLTKPLSQRSAETSLAPTTCSKRCAALLHRRPVLPVASWSPVDPCVRVQAALSLVPFLNEDDVAVWWGARQTVSR